MEMGNRGALFLLLLYFAWPLTQVMGKATHPESCSGGSCRAIATYFPAENLLLSRIALLFSIADYTQLLGPNDLNLSIPNLPNLALPAGHPFFVPFDCGCRNSTRVATSINYTVVKGDTLSTIALTYYSFLVSYQEIGDASGVVDYDKIDINQTLTIPIPCSCNNTTSIEALSYQIQSGDNLTTVAQEYGTSAAELRDFNGGAVNDTDLSAKDILFVPLSVCTPNFSSTATDNNLRVIEGRYELTANNCVQCNCHNGLLYCIPSNFSTSTTNACGNLMCANSNLTLGAFNTSQNNSGCLVQSCVYIGYSNATGILSRLQTDFDPTCPAPPPPESFYNPSNVTAPTPPTPPQTPTTTTPTLTPPSGPPSLAPPIMGSLFSTLCKLLIVEMCVWALFFL